MLVLCWATSVSAALVHRWDLNESSGTSLIDLAGGCNGAIHGTLARPEDGPPATALPDGATVLPEQCFRFEGSDANYIDFGADVSLSPIVLSVAFWIRAAEDANEDYAGKVIVSKHGGNTTSSWEFGFSPGAGDTARLQFINCGGSGKVYTRSNRFTAADFKDGGWHHVAGVCDGTTARLYVDGALMEMRTQIRTSQPSSTYPMVLGRRSYEDSQANRWAYSGDVGGPLLIYNNALSDAEIAAMAGYSPPPRSRELLGRWDLCQATGTTTPKVAGPGDGQINGNVTLADGGPPGVTLPDGVQASPAKHFLFGGAAGDNINLGHDDSFNPREMTFAIWAKAAGNHAGQVLVAKRSKTKGSFELAFEKSLASGQDELCFKVNVGSATAEKDDSSSATAGSTSDSGSGIDAFTTADFNDGNWHLFVGTHDGEYSSLYVDGELLDRVLNRGFVNYSGEAADLLIGDNGVAGKNDNQYSGRIGGPFLFYDHALSPQAILAMYENRVLLPGDADGNGSVDADDARAMAENWMANGASWSQGDFNYDGRVDDADAAILAANWQKTAPPATSTPEPGGILLLIMGALGIAFAFPARRRW